MIGRIVGNYKIVQALGEGGVGMVYKGIDTMLDREVAIKVLRPELASQTSVVERFRSEAVTLAKLSHPNIATLYSLFRDGQDLLMVLEFLKGETLDHALYRRGRIPTDEAVPIFCQALEGINYAHKLGIVHRDIKPGNMMLTEEGIVKVLDFGIARLLGSARMTRVGNVIGTLEYMSPEQVKGHETDARSDVYGLGIMLYEMLTGRLPFESENDFALMKMQTENTPTPPRDLNPEIPVEVENAIMKAVAKDPEWRFQSAGEFLEHFLEIGFAVPNNTFGAIYRKTSRPSKPGINSAEITTDSTLPMAKIEPEATLPLIKVSGEQTLPAANIQSEKTLPLANLQPTDSNTLPPSQIPTAIFTSQPDITANLENAEELSKAKIAETRLAPNQAEIKGTRLAAPVTPTQPELKATRLGSAVTSQLPGDSQDSSSSPFFKLNWMHYTGAGALMLFLFALVATAGILSFAWGNNETSNGEPKSPANSVNSAPTATPVSQPVAKDEPSKPSIQSDGGMPLAPANPSISNTGIPIGTPAPTGAKTDAPPEPAQKQPKERETAKTNPPAAPRQQQQPKTQPQQPRSSGGTAANTVRAPDETGSKGAARNVMTNSRKGDN